MIHTKGISAIIASILLLLIVIAIVGYAFGFFNKLFQTAGSEGEKQLGSAASQMQQAARIENAAGTSLTVRNTGSVSLNTSSVSVYINNALTVCTGWTPQIVAPQGTSTCTLASSCPGGAAIKVTTPGLTDSGTC